jgi:hypothetical protein
MPQGMQRASLEAVNYTIPPYEAEFTFNQSISGTALFISEELSSLQYPEVPLIAGKPSSSPPRMLTSALRY